MTATPVSVIVVSRGRPDALMRCLTGIGQLDHPMFEIVVVVDTQSHVRLDQSRFAGRIKAIAFDEANISAARNRGLAAAAGEAVAFIDDDAVPEPSWLRHLAAAFEDPQVDAAGGYVRGRNGISFQHRARSVDALGDHADLEIPDDAPRVVNPGPGRAVKTEGTNCAFRREVLAELGGFDPAFAFCLDETDLNLRLAAQGCRTAIVPLAQVHHGFAASERRRADRMPRSLFDIGASQAVLLRKHAPESDPGPVLARLRAEQKARLLRHMVAGRCEPRDVGRLMRTLEAGIAEGAVRGFGGLASIGRPTGAFLRFMPDPPFRGSRMLAGRVWQARRLRAEAARQVALGERISLFLFSPTALYHRVTFTASGVWEQRGGLWGRSERREAIFSASGFAARVRREVERVGRVRNLEMN